MISDLLIYETGSGGDLLLKNNDLATIAGYENSQYLSMFGGSDFWGNYLSPDNQFIAKTEAILKITPLTSSGRIAIENAIKADLSYLDNIPATKWDAVLTIANADRLDIIITINGKVFSYSWNPNDFFLTYQV